MSRDNVDTAADCVDSSVDSSGLLTAVQWCVDSSGVFVDISGHLTASSMSPCHTWSRYMLHVSVSAASAAEMIHRPVD